VKDDTGGGFCSEKKERSSCLTADGAGQRRGEQRGIPTGEEKGRKGTAKPLPASGGKRSNGLCSSRSRKRKKGGQTICVDAGEVNVEHELRKKKKNCARQQECCARPAGGGGE